MDPHTFGACTALHRTALHCTVVPCTQAAMLAENIAGGMEVKVVDIWTEYGRFPWNKMAAGYPFCCKHSFVWKAMYYTTIGLELPTDLLWRTQCGAGFKRCIGEYDPDMVVSLHPLCQNLPLKVAFPGYHPRTSPAPPASHSPHPLSLPELAARGGVPWLSPPLEVAAAPGCTARAVHAVLCMHALHRALHRALHCRGRQHKARRGVGARGVRA